MKIQRNLVITTPFAPPPLSLPHPHKIKEKPAGARSLESGEIGGGFPAQLSRRSCLPRVIIIITKHFREQKR